MTRPGTIGVLLVAALVLARCTGSGADDASSVDPCADAETQLELTTCWAEQASAAEQELDQTYARARALFEERDQPDAAASLAESETLWARYRDRHCESASGIYEGGSGEELARARCRARLAMGQSTEVREAFLAADDA
jgi:uncharacterized protein YecT (DUF1311 family)